MKNFFVPHTENSTKPRPNNKIHTAKIKPKKTIAVAPAAIMGHHECGE
jgi:hypothetical protein